ncbi:MAG: hypothetical protein HQM09_13050 [Candidatus Riflebacteria bacterium]|nr:hypothetical protein [Candidatus Riflebacteria bacterium]
MPTFPSRHLFSGASAVGIFLLVLSILPFVAGCGDSGGKSDKASPLPLVPVENTVPASGERFGRGLPGVGTLNAISNSDLQAVQAGSIATAVAGANIGAYLPVGTLMPATTSAQAASRIEPSSVYGSELLPVRLSELYTVRSAVVATLTAGIQTLVSTVDAASGTTTPTVAWPAFLIPHGYVADDLRLIGLSAGTGTGTTAPPLPVFQIMDTFGKVAFSFTGAEISAAGNLPARVFTPVSVPLSQVRLYPVSADVDRPWRIVAAGGPGAFAQVAMRVHETPDLSTEGVVALPLTSGALQVTLTWNTTADIDLHMVEPGDGTASPTRVHYGNPYGNTLIMDREDNTDGSDGFGPENIFMPSEKTPIGNGSYSIFLHYYQAWPAYSPSGRTTCLVRVKTKSETRVFERVLEASGTMAMVAEISYAGDGTTTILEKVASSPTPWSPPGPGQLGNRRGKTARILSW